MCILRKRSFPCEYNPRKPLKVGGIYRSVTSIQSPDRTGQDAQLTSQDAVQLRGQLWINANRLLRPLKSQPSHELRWRDLCLLWVTSNIQRQINKNMDRECQWGKSGPSSFISTCIEKSKKKRRFKWELTLFVCCTGYQDVRVNPPGQENWFSGLVTTPRRWAHVHYCNLFV